ncbi:MAG: hypothetical protein WC753_01400 [Candidatus Gracilibacteria bacterium]
MANNRNTIQNYVEKIKTHWLFWVIVTIVSVIILPYLSVRGNALQMESNIISQHDEGNMVNLKGNISDPNNNSGEIVIRNNLFKETIKIENTSDKEILSSDDKNPRISSKIHIFCTQDGELRELGMENLPEEGILPTGYKMYLLKSSFEKCDSVGILRIDLVCKDTEFNICNPLFTGYENKFKKQIDPSLWQIIGVDATWIDDDISFETFRNNLENAYDQSSVKFFKTIPGLQAFGRKGPKSKNGWEGIIILFNTKYSEESDIIKEVKQRIISTYGGYEVFLYPNTEGNFKKYSAHISQECGNYCNTHTLQFGDLKSGMKGDENVPLPKELFDANSDLDAIIFLPY